MKLADYVKGVAEGRRGVLVQRQKDRSVWRIEEKRVVWFAKRGLTPKRRREIRRETENTRMLEEAGFGPSVLAAGTHAGAEWLITANASSWVDLSHPASLTPVGADGKSSVVDLVAKGLRKFHDAGFATPDLTGDHVFWGGGEEVRVIDAARLERRRSPTPVRVRARDLAALVFSLRYLWLDRFRRIRFLREALGQEAEALRRSMRLIDAEVFRLASRTRWRHGLSETTEDFHQALTEATERSRRALFEATGIPGIGWVSEFDQLIDGVGASVVRTLPDRVNRTIGRGPDGRPRYFVKAFPPTRNGLSPAMREMEAIDLFRRAGILVNRVAAYAEDVDRGSLVAVRGCGGEPLDDLLRRGVTVAERRALTVETARIWRRMRECGLRHRDAYPCHLFAARAARGFELRLIDMTRAGLAPFPKERWFVKDAAALWHGCPRPPVTRTDAVRWLREYFRIERLDAGAKRFARRVAAKEHRIAARQARKGRR